MKAKILIVDDDKDLVMSYEILLEALGHTVACAYDGREGLEKAREFCPDLIILDVMMATKTEGIDVAREIQNTPQLHGVPVILITGVRRAMDLGFSLSPDQDFLPVEAVLEKPVRPEELVARIEAAVSKRNTVTPLDSPQT
jgi:CheY-like chemotaxis protein